MRFFTCAEAEQHKRGTEGTAAFIHSTTREVFNDAGAEGRGADAVAVAVGRRKAFGQRI